MRLSINLATRGRPQLLRNTIERTLGNIALPSTIFMVSVDEDDQASIKVANDYLDRIAVSVMPREDALGEKYNRVLKVAPADVYLAMVDESPIITKDFDAKILEAAQVYPDGYACVVGPLANLSFACLYAVTEKFAGKMGGIFPPYFPYWFIDHWLDDIAQMTGRMVATDVVSDFWSHPTQTIERREPGFWGTFYDRLAPERERIAHSIITAPDFDDTPARKQALIRNFARKRQHSAMINNNCRQNDKEWGDPSRDDRYQRIRDNAVRVLDQFAAKAA